MDEIVVENVTLAELATLLDIDTTTIGCTDIDELGLHVLAPGGFKHVSSFVVKERTQGWQLGDLLASNVHRVFDDATKSWRHVSDMPNAAATGKLIDVVDLEVPDGECYIANGWVNHNTTPGGWN